MVSGVFLGWFLVGVSVLSWYFLLVSLRSLGGDSSVSRCFLGGFLMVSWWFLGGFLVVSRLFLGCFFVVYGW